MTIVLHVIVELNIGNMQPSFQLPPYRATNKAVTA